MSDASLISGLVSESAVQYMWSGDGGGRRAIRAHRWNCGNHFPTPKLKIMVHFN
jgi:hypothetical protein